MGGLQIEAAYPYSYLIRFPCTGFTARQQLTRLQTEMQCDIPSVHVDWFIATASLPPLYHDLLSLPLTDRELETRLEVDVAQNLQNAPGVRVWRAGTNDSRVSSHNRVIERHKSRYGAYWKSYDFAGSVGTQNIFNHPLSFTPDGGEAIFNLPNGLQGYYVVNAFGARLDAAPIGIVSNPAASDPTVRNGLSCFGCHTEGMKPIVDQIRPVIESNATPTYDKAQALRLYVPQAEIDALVQEDKERFSQALQATGGSINDIEPIARFHEAFQGSVDVAYAAAVVGLETEAFRKKIRENQGLQNAGLLVLDSPNGSMKRDAWTDGFGDIIFALDFPESLTPPIDKTPTTPGAVVRILDSNLRAAIAETLGKSPNALITVEEMEGLSELDAEDKGIRDLTGLQFAINLSELNIGDNEVSDLSPLTGLINLRHLGFSNNPISDISPLRALINLEGLRFSRTSVSDLSSVAGLVNLKYIGSWGHNISDLSPLAGLTKLEEIDFCGGNISDLTPLTGLTNLKEVYVTREQVSDISPLASLIGLTRLGLHHNNISDVSPLTKLINLTWIAIYDNDISDISPLINLTNLKWVSVRNNKISNLPLLKELSKNMTLIWYGNPAFPKGGPKIEGPWLWVVFPDKVSDFDKGTDLLSEASNGTVTETKIATHGATEGRSIGEEVWAAHKLPPTGTNNMEDMLGRSLRGAIIYGVICLHSPHQQKTTMFVSNDSGLKVWINGDLVYKDLSNVREGIDYEDFFPVTLKQGKNILLVGIRFPNGGEDRNALFGFEPGTEYTAVTPGVGYTFSKTPIHAGETFTLDIRAENVSDMAGWQFDIAFDHNALEAISVNEGDFLKQNGASTLFQGGSINNGAGKITELSTARLAPSGVSGSGTLVQVSFKAKRGGETKLTLQNFQFATITGDTIPAGPHEITISIEGQLSAGDVNRDGQVTVADLILVAAQLGKRVPIGTTEDVNGDGIVNMLDLLVVAQAIDSPAAPVAVGRNIDAAMIEAWIAQGRLEDDGSVAFRQGIENLRALLRSLIPEETALLRNYPNPFNPETWIPYQLAQSAEVTLTIYDMNGEMVRRLAVGHKAAGVYQSRSRAVYWDGRNQLGESVTSGLYFYTLTTGDFTGTRRMVILK